MIESSSFGGSLSKLWLAERTADGVSAVTDTDVNGLMRANRAYISAKKYILGATQTVRYSGRVCQYVALRGVNFYATWVVPQEIISCPIKAVWLWGRVFCFYWVH